MVSIYVNMKMRRATMPRQNERRPYFRPKWSQFLPCFGSKSLRNHIPFRGTHTTVPSPVPSPYKRVPPSPPQPCTLSTQDMGTLWWAGGLVCHLNYFFSSVYNYASFVFKFLFLCLFLSSHYVPDLHYNEIIGYKLLWSINSTEQY